MLSLVPCPYIVIVVRLITNLKMADPHELRLDSGSGCEGWSVSPPVLWISDDVEKDGHGCLVIGTLQTLPNFSNNILPGIAASDNRTTLLADEQLPNLLEQSQGARKKVELISTQYQRSRLHGRLRDTPTKRHNNKLRQQAAEVASQHPEYGGLVSSEREKVWDDAQREHPNTASRVDMRRYDVRMATFNDNSLPWPQKIPSSDQLARVGLYYLGAEDRVRCFSCDVELEEWGEEDPLTRHYLASKHCAFLRQDFSDQLQSLKSSPQHPQIYTNVSVRLHSFAQWPISDVITSYQLASVGFYYTGEGTKVICFSCGLVVREWKRGDVPLLVHCRTNPDCQFIKSIIKGAPSSARPPSPELKTLRSSANKPDFSDVQIRLKSFKKLSPAFPIPRQQLAEAGLFLLRLPDVMKCHSCGTVLQDWIEGDTAVEKHRGASPNCHFLAERFPSKLSSPGLDFDPDDLPAAQFNEKELEVMASYHHPAPSLPSPTQPPSLPSPTQLPSLPSPPQPPSLPSPSQPPSLPTPVDSLSFATLTVSDTLPSSSSHTPSLSSSAYLAEPLPNPHPFSLSHQASSGYHSTLPPSSLTETHHFSLSHQASSGYHSTLPPSSLTQTQPLSLPPSSLTQTQPLSLPHPTSSGYHSMTIQPSPLSTLTPQSSADVPSSLATSLSIPSTGEVGGKTVSLPPSYSHASSTPSLTLPSSDIPQQPSSIAAASGECVVCMDRPLEMVFVPCGHICVCEICSSQITRCPICRTRTQMAVKVYYPY